VARRRPTRRHALQLEYRFDRLLAVKLEQVYQLLVPNKRWPVGVSAPSPVRSIMPMEGPSAARCTTSDTAPSPTLRFSIFSQSSQTGIAGESITSLRSKPLTAIPRIACTTMKMLAADHACGWQATG
jgi:hypothetical protein